MAGGWRRYLEEESEHQWLAISGFFLFILLGALALEGTSDFVGDDMVRVSNQHQGAMVLDIVHHGESGTYTALVYAPTVGYHMFTEFADGSVNTIYQPEGVDMGREVTFLTTIEGQPAFSSAPNSWIVLQNGAMVTYEIQANGELFDVHDIAKHRSDERVMVLTQEGQNTTVRGVSNLQATSPMSTSSGVQWDRLIHLHDDQWVATGHHIATAGADGSSPATPERRPTVGFIQWQGANATPTLTGVRMLSGTFHSLISTDDGAVIGGSLTSHHVGLDATITDIDAPSSVAIADAEDNVWFLGDQGSTTVGIYTNGVYEIETLSKPMPISTTVVALNGATIDVHGTNGEGEPAQWSIDTKANGSIESGRGFLNLLFMIAGGAILGMMCVSATRSLTQEQRS